MMTTLTTRLLLAVVAIAMLGSFATYSFAAGMELSEALGKSSLLSHVRVGLKPSPSGEGFSMI